MVLRVGTLVDEPVFHFFAGPGGFAQKGEAGLHGGIELKTTNGDASAHFAPAVFLNELVEDVFQRDAVQRIAGMGGRRWHWGGAMTCKAMIISRYDP